MSLNVQNLDKLITHLEAQPPERINMGAVTVQHHACGTCGCIIGHADLIWPEIEPYEVDEQLGLAGKLWIGRTEVYQLTHPTGWSAEIRGVTRYPAHRVIATLKRLRDRYLATGEVVVDWGPEPTAGEPWSTPHAVETTKISEPELPVEITRFLGEMVEA